MGALYFVLCSYQYEVGKKFDDCGTRFDEIGTKYNPGENMRRDLPPKSKFRWINRSPKAATGGVWGAKPPPAWMRALGRRQPPKARKSL